LRSPAFVAAETVLQALWVPQQLRRIALFLPMRLLLCDPWLSWKYAPRVTCPTLILAASHDEIVPVGDTRKLLDAFRPGVTTLRVTEGTGHNSVSGPEEFWQALVEGR
jgi:pimeloyl-ACP methyl ester carboxylesterase